jgi:hypothetical protein
VHPELETRSTREDAPVAEELSVRTGPATDIINLGCRILLLAINPSPRSTAANLPFAGPKTTPIGASRGFVPPNPSGRSRAYPGFQSKLRWYQRLAREEQATVDPR